MGITGRGCKRASLCRVCTRPDDVLAELEAHDAYTLRLRVGDDAEHNIVVPGEVIELRQDGSGFGLNDCDIGILPGKFLDGLD